MGFTFDSKDVFFTNHIPPDSTNTVVEPPLK